jgi:hypothetical protein
MNGKSIVGKEYGRWQVIAKTEKRSKHGKPIYVCRCNCGTEREMEAAYLGEGRSCGCIIRESRQPIGHRIIIKGTGYVLLKTKDDDRAKGRDNYTYEHKWIMQQIIGRKLLPDEAVHHKNGVRDDNRPENLELWSKSHPCGQRVTDLVVWAKEILARYEK